LRINSKEAQRLGFQSRKLMELFDNSLRNTYSFKIILFLRVTCRNFWYRKQRSTESCKR